jgi:hypothetical protein
MVCLILMNILNEGSRHLVRDTVSLGEYNTPYLPTQLLFLDFLTLKMEAL